MRTVPCFRVHQHAEHLHQLSPGELPVDYKSEPHDPGVVDRLLILSYDEPRLETRGLRDT